MSSKSVTMQSLKKQLDKLAMSLKNNKTGNSTNDDDDKTSDKLAVILREEIKAGNNDSDDDNSINNGNSSKGCSTCRHSNELLTTLMQKISDMNAKLDALLPPPISEQQAAQAQLAAQAEMAVEAAIAVAAAPSIIHATQHPAFVVTESQQAAPQAVALAPQAVVLAPRATTFEQVAQARNIQDITILRRMLNDTWREHTKNIYSAQRLAEEPTDPPSAMDVFRDRTAELAADDSVVVDRHAFMTHLRGIVKFTAAGIVAAVPENPNARLDMLEMWGAEWIAPQ